MESEKVGEEAGSCGGEEDEEEIDAAAGTSKEVAQSSGQVSNNQQNQGRRKRWKATKQLNLIDYVIEGRRDVTSHEKPAVEKQKPKESKSKVPQIRPEKLSLLKKKLVSEKREADKQPKKPLGGAPGESFVCCSVCSKQVEEATLKFLSRVKELQDRVWKENPTKAHAKRRIVCGLREVKKHLMLGDVKCVVIARDLEGSREEDVLGGKLHEIKQMCSLNDVTLLNVCRKHKIGKALNMVPFVSSVAIIDFSGVEDLYQTVLAEYQSYLVQSRIAEHIEQLSLFA